MDCPKCHKPLKSESLHGEHVDRCIACDGLWFDHSELGPIVRMTVPPSFQPKSVSCPDGIACPKCGRFLAPFNYAHDSGVFLNKCASCGGVWLESGQLELIAQYRSGTPAIQRLTDVLAKDRRISDRFQFARRLLRSRVLSFVVVVGYLLVVLFATGNLHTVFSLALFLLLPTACIWFPDAMGNLKGISLGLSRPMITQSTPGDFVAIGGWLLLLCPLVVALFLRA